MTRPYAEVIGDPIAHSKSPIIHNFWLEKLGIDADYRRCHVKAEELADYFARRRGDAEWRGCNVTMPHKMAVMELVDALDQMAERVGAVNTIVPSGGRQLTGFNTDVEGIAEPLRSMPIGGYPAHVTTYVYIIGAGGAARAAVVGAQMAGYFDINVYNRSVEKAHPLAEMANSAFHEAHSLEYLVPIRNDGDGPDDQQYSIIVINASRMGMLGTPPVPIDLGRFYPDTIVFDLVYTPLETPLLDDSRRLGLRTIDGLAMLIGQAASAFGKFFGQPAPREYDAELRALLTK